MSLIGTGQTDLCLLTAYHDRLHGKRGRHDQQSLFLLDRLLSQYNDLSNPIDTFITKQTQALIIQQIWQSYPIQLISRFLEWMHIPELCRAIHDLIGVSMSEQQRRDEYQRLWIWVCDPEDVYSFWNQLLQHWMQKGICVENPLDANSILINPRFLLEACSGSDIDHLRLNNTIVASQGSTDKAQEAHWIPHST